MSEDIKALIEDLRYHINNPSAWDTFDQGVSDLIEQGVAALERLSGRVSEWKPIETAPQGDPNADEYHRRAGPRILVANDDRVSIMRREYTYKHNVPKWKLDDGRSPFWTPTRWMPLPAPAGEAAALEPAPTPDAREKALREAAEVVRNAPLGRHGPDQEELADAILALISTGGGDDHNA